MACVTSLGGKPPAQPSGSVWEAKSQDLVMAGTQKGAQGCSAPPETMGWVWRPHVFSRCSHSMIRLCPGTPRQAEQGWADGRDTHELFHDLRGRSSWGCVSHRPVFLSPTSRGDIS